MKNASRTLRVLAPVLAAGLLLGACSKDETTTTGAGAGGATTAPTTATTTASTTASTAKSGGSDYGKDGGDYGKDGATTATTAKAPDGKVELKVVDTPYGKAIGRGDGKVLYTWDKEADAGNKISCVEAKCLDKWPPLTATAFSVGAGLDASSFSLVDRPDGSKQVAIDGRALYAMAADEPGDANCQGLDGWWILNADGTKNSSKTAATP